MAEELIKEFHDKLFCIGNHQEYGLFKETYEDRFNQLLSESHEILQMPISLEKRVEIMCWQFWIVGNMTGQKLNIKEENEITPELIRERIGFVLKK